MRRILWYIVRFPFMFLMFVAFWLVVATGIPQLILNTSYTEPFTDGSLEDSVYDVFMPWNYHG